MLPPGVGRQCVFFGVITLMMAFVLVASLVSTLNGMADSLKALKHDNTELRAIVGQGAQGASAPPAAAASTSAAAASVDMYLQFREQNWDQVDLTPYNKIAEKLSALGTKKKEGHSAELVLERKIYVVAAKLPSVKRICEIGFNGGHSTSLWLLANPTANVTMFDLWEHGADYGGKAEAFLRSEEAKKFGLKNVDARLTIIKGDSARVVPEFAAKHPEVLCDIVSVDGGHATAVAFQDLHNMKALANPKGHLLLLDDTNCAQCNRQVDAARDQQRTLGNVQVLVALPETVDLGDGMGRKQSRGITVMRYVF